MSTKQERTSKANRKAKVLADDIIAKAIARINAQKLEADAPTAETWFGNRAPETDTETVAASVRRLREEGMAWWAIGKELQLPGHGDSATTGKGGAAAARRLYASAFGEVPRVQRERGSTTPTERNADRAALKKQKRNERVTAVKRGNGVLRPDMSDAEVVDMLRGRKISWLINLDHLDGMGDSFTEDNAEVHRIFLKVIECKSGRALKFVDVITRQRRTVRLDGIVTVR